MDTPEADAVQKKFKTLSADQLHDLYEAEKFVAFYIHGTHCAGIAVRGNPAARLVVARFDDQLPDLPFPPTEEWARRLAADFRQISDYYKTPHVRVVNMSWWDNVPEFETWLSKQGGGADPVRRKNRRKLCTQSGETRLRRRSRTPLTPSSWRPPETATATRVLVVTFRLHCICRT